MVLCEYHRVRGSSSHVSCHPLVGDRRLTCSMQQPHLHHSMLHRHVEAIPSRDGCWPLVLQIKVCALWHIYNCPITYRDSRYGHSRLDTRALPPKWPATDFALQRCTIHHAECTDHVSVLEPYFHATHAGKLLHRRR
jgi:hypothetical protein